MLPILLVGIGLLGCTGDLPTSEGPSTVHATAADPELCDEHGVLESVCPKCNPKLAAVFQANGDWCDEHGFPESFCPFCHPERGGRPQADVADDGSPPDGTIVRFKTKEGARLTGLELAEAVEAPWTGGTTAVARLVWDPTLLTLVSARAPGIVTGVRADVGTPVVPGDPLAVVRSAEVGGERSRLAAATRAVEIAEADLARKQHLLEGGVSSQREVLAAEQALASAEADLGALRAELGFVGTGAGDTYTITAPQAGVVTARHASVGQSVDSGAPLFEVVDASRMWAELDVAEADLAHVVEGQTVEVVLDALPDRVFVGTIDYIAPSLDPRTRTVVARVVLDNADRTLREHMYGTARIATTAAAAVVTVPSAAVQSAGEVDLVFVRKSADEYVARRVTVIGREGGLARVSGGVVPGDTVVTTGSFLLKTETLKDSIGAGCCDVE